MTLEAQRKGKRRKALGLGHSAEWWAAAYLFLKGYRLLARRVGGKGGEIDLILRRRKLIIFVEVKARADRDMALMSVTPEKMRLIGRTARAWLSRNPWAEGLSYRGDIVAVAGWRKPAHVEGAFDIL